MSGWRKRKILEHYKQTIDEDCIFFRNKPLACFIYTAGICGLVWKIAQELLT